MIKNPRLATLLLYLEGMKTQIIPLTTIPLAYRRTFGSALVPA